MSPVKSEPVIEFATQRAWGAWLQTHHATSQGITMRLAKKASGIASVTYPEALDVALCYGWIDGLKKSDGDSHYTQRFTPRKPASIWSKVNRDKVLALIEAGRMQPAGLAEIERAKRDGRWADAYDGPSKATVPPDLQAALDASPPAKEFFKTLNGQNRYAILFRLQTAKKPETRARRLATFVDMLEKKQLLYPLMLFALLPLALLPLSLSAQAVADSLRLYYVGRPVGWETYQLTATDSGRRLTADLDYIDRGRRNHLQSSTTLGADYAPRHLEVLRAGDTSRVVVTRVDVDGRHASVLRNGSVAEVDLPIVAFAISPYTPVSQHVALLRYWTAHGSPATIAVVPGGPTNQVSIARSGVDTVNAGGRRTVITRYAIDGLVWGVEYVWLDESERLAMFAGAAGGLSFKAVRAELVPFYPDLMMIASRAAMRDLAAISARTPPMAEGELALVGANLIDGSGRPAVRNATVIVSGGRVVAAGPSGSTPVPKSTRSIDVRGKTIVPGLWDMHAHLHQLEWVPVYLAAGVTSVRDMGNELAFVTALRETVRLGQAAGPHIFLAGLIDGDGPNAFGALSASTSAQGRDIVRRYHALGFEEMKLYSLLAPNVVGAICDEAHKLGMTVTGHIPNSLTLTAAVDSGMDQVAHLPLRGDPQSDSVKRVIAHLRARGTVIDPTASWGEIGGHSTAESVQAFQPVLQHLPPAFTQFRVAGWGSAAIDPATAHARLDRTLAMIRALYEAGVPIVAGTDEGVPGYSVYREMELYVRAGMSPMDAIRAATAVPARAMRVDKDVGTIERGKRADLLVLDENPLVDIANIRTVRSVMHDGRLYDSAALWRGVGFTP